MVTAVEKINPTNEIIMLKIVVYCPCGIISLSDALPVVQEVTWEKFYFLLKFHYLSVFYFLPKLQMTHMQDLRLSFLMHYIYPELTLWRSTRLLTYKTDTTNELLRRPLTYEPYKHI
jgi:hypothetical protein